MKQKTKIILVSISICLASANIYCKNAEISSAIDTTKVAFFLDGKQVYARELIERIKQNDVNPLGSAYTTRKCLLYYGEKYRNGIMIYVSKKKKEK